MSQIALPLPPPFARDDAAPRRIVVGAANAAVVEALAHPATWSFLAAVLTGPARSGKSLFARWFAETGAGEAIDDAPLLPEADLFHRWNRAQEQRRPLLIVGGEAGVWRVALPDLASRLGAARQLAIGAPDDALLAALLAHHAETRGFALDPAAIAYLAPRCERSHMGVETLVATIDRLSLERLQPPTLSLLRDALRQVGVSDGGEEDQLTLL